MDIKQFANLYYRLMDLKDSVKKPLEKKMEMAEKKMENKEDMMEKQMYKKVRAEVIKKASKKGMK
jgi:hypothetical protein